jgi:hypothetical protein
MKRLPSLLILLVSSLFSLAELCVEDARRISFKFQGLDQQRLSGMEEHNPAKGLLA